MSQRRVIYHLLALQMQPDLAGVVLPGCVHILRHAPTEGADIVVQGDQGGDAKADGTDDVGAVGPGHTPIHPLH